MNKNCNKDVMKTFLIEKGIDVVDVIKMTREEVLDNVGVKSMKVIVKASEFEKAMDPTVWPCRVGVRLWKDKEAQKARFERWQEQNKGRSSGVMKGRSSGAGSGAKERGRAKDAGSQQRNSYRNREKSGNRYQGNIFEDLLRQVLKA